MRQIKTSTITEAVKELCIKANYELREDVVEALKKATKKEKSHLGQKVLETIIRNVEIAKEAQVPLCQDTGITTVFAEVGQGVEITSGLLKQAIVKGVSQGYREGYLRGSVVADPCFLRKNSGDNTPPVIHLDCVKGRRLNLKVMPKGGGSENVSAMKMLPLSSGLDGIKDFVVNSVREAGSFPCPPVVVGVGIGGNFELAPLLAKKALLRKLDDKSSHPKLAGLEKELTRRINDLGIGPAGVGGTITTLAVKIATYPTHLATLPVAVNISCWALRSAEVSL